MLFRTLVEENNSENGPSTSRVVEDVLIILDRLSAITRCCDHDVDALSFGRDVFANHFGGDDIAFRADVLVYWWLAESFLQLLRSC